MAQHDQAPTSKVVEQDLCLTCGLCCDGSWYRTGVLAADEVDTARQQEFHVDAKDADAAFLQPCVKFCAGRCSAYAQWRPAVCASYRCGLLEKLADDRIQRAQADSAVAEAKRLFGEIRAVRPDFTGLLSSESTEMLEARSNGTGQLGLSPALELKAVALLILFRKYFQRAPKAMPAERGHEGAAGE